VTLATACARHGLGLLCFSGTRLFDGSASAPYLEGDAPTPLDAQGRRLADIEAQVTAACADALVVRSGDWFGRDGGDFLSRLCTAVREGGAGGIALDAHTLRSPACLPDLIDACLNLLIDREKGLWHLYHGDPVSDLELARRACRAAGLCEEGLRPLVPLEQAGHGAMRAIGSLRGKLLPSLDDALRRSIIPTTSRQIR
jgi:dTDP-4-dehydrorhamnose reductase